MIPLAGMKRYCCRIICYLNQLLLVLYSQTRNKQTQTYTNKFKLVDRLFILSIIILHLFKSFPILKSYTTKYNWFCQLGAQIISQTIVIYPIHDFLHYLLLISIFCNYGPPHVIMGFLYINNFNIQNKIFVEIIIPFPSKVGFCYVFIYKLGNQKLWLLIKYIWNLLQIICSSHIVLLKIYYISTLYICVCYYFMLLSLVLLWQIFLEIYLLYFCYYLFFIIIIHWFYIMIFMDLQILVH